MSADGRSLKRKLGLGVGFGTRRMLPLTAAAMCAGAARVAASAEGAKRVRRTLELNETHTEVEVVSLWLQGHTSGMAVQRLFGCISKDFEEGRNIQDIAATLGSIGASGAAPQNCQRDLFRKFSTVNKIIEPYNFNVERRCPKTGVTVDTPFSMVPPHEVMGALYTRAPEAFDRRVGSEEDIREFWANLNVDDPAYKDIMRHVKKKKGWQRKCIPFRIHEDGVAYLRGSRATCYIMSISSILGRGSSTETRFFICATAKPKKTQTPRTQHDIFKAVKWSLAALNTGVYPAKDHNGKAVKGVRKRLKGQNIFGGRFGYVMFLGGDMQHLCDTWRLRHTGAKMPCFRCNAVIDMKLCRKNGLPPTFVFGDNIGEDPCWIYIYIY